MRRGGRTLPAALLAWAAFALPSLGQAASQVTVDFSNPGLSPPHWTLTISPDGSGHFHSERGTAQAENPQTIDAPDVDRDFRVSAAFADKVFETARGHKWFAFGCESHMKVAFQGRKRLSYSGPEGQGACEFNYSKDKEIQALGDSLVAVAGTILEGARLEKLLQHDPLGLDHELEYVSDAVGDGRVQQICVIRGILERLAEDSGVMERVRKRARILLGRVEK
jgi:hypothetical protein